MRTFTYAKISKTGKDRAYTVLKYTQKGLNMFLINLINVSNHSRSRESVHLCYIDPSNLNVKSISEIVMAVFSMTFYFVLFAMTLLSLKSNIGRRINSSKELTVFCFGGVLIISINVFTNESNLPVRETFRICSALLVGVVLEIVGAWKFFVSPGLSASARARSRKSTLGVHHPSMGSVIGLITFLLVLIEVFLTVGASKDIKINAVGSENERKLSNACLIVLTIQKITQALIYIYIRQCYPCLERKHSAALFLKILSLYNFTAWIESLSSIRNDLNYSQADIIYGPAFNIPETVYEALLIDFRLLCSMLFLEHAFAIEKTLQDDQDLLGSAIGSSASVCVNTMNGKEKLFRTLGLTTGCIFVVLNVIRGLQYVPQLRLSPWLHSLAIPEEIFLIVAALAIMRINKPNLEEKTEDEEEERGIEIMVSGMGIISVLYWGIKSILTLYWASGFHDLSMRTYFGNKGTNLLGRAVCCAFLIPLFLKIKTDLIVSRNRAVSLNYFLVPSIMTGSLSVFFGSAIDQYVGEIDTRIACEPLSETLKLLFQAGPPIHLGFCIHLFIHFLTIQLKMGKTFVDISSFGSTNNEHEPLLNQRKENTRSFRNQLLQQEIV